MSIDSQLGRAARILDVIAIEQKAMRYSELQEALDGLNPASLNRLLRSMTEIGLLHHDQQVYWPSVRVKQWADGVAEKASLSERAQPYLDKISEEFSATTILLEQQGKRIVSAAKCLHEHAPSLMSVGKRFPPRLPYFSCIFWAKPPQTGLRKWVQSQMVDIDEAVSRRIDGGVTVTKFFLDNGYYYDEELFPGQTRFGVAIKNADSVQAIIGASILSGSANKKQEKALAASLFDAANALSV